MIFEPSQPSGTTASTSSSMMAVVNESEPARASGTAPLMAPRSVLAVSPAAGLAAVLPSPPDALSSLPQPVVDAAASRSPPTTR